jgi:hypothetical protein
MTSPALTRARAPDILRAILPAQQLSSLAMFTAIVVNERPLAVSLGLGAICQGPRSTWCSEKSSDQNSALENVIDWLKSAIHISA